MDLQLKNIRKPGHRIDHHVIEKYGEKLESQGWAYSIGAGGYISPDRSAIFYTSRAPYFGRVMKNSQNGDYRSTVVELYKTGDFRGI